MNNWDRCSRFRGILENLGLDTDKIEEAHDTLTRVSALLVEIDELTDVIDEKLSVVAGVIASRPIEDVIVAAFPGKAFTQEAVRKLNLSGDRLVNVILDFEL